MSYISIINAVDPDSISRRRDIDIVAGIPGRYTLTRQIDASGNRRGFSGRVVKIPANALTLVASVKRAKGERVVVTLPESGKLECPVIKTHDSGFVREST
jgi:hypothetical protein